MSAGANVSVPPRQGSDSSSVRLVSDEPGDGEAERQALRGLSVIRARDRGRPGRSRPARCAVELGAGEFGASEHSGAPAAIALHTSSMPYRHARPVCGTERA